MWLASLVGAGQGVRAEHASPEGSVRSETGPRLKGPERRGGGDLSVQSAFDVKGQRSMEAAWILTRGQARPAEDSHADRGPQSGGGHGFVSVSGGAG